MKLEHSKPLRPHLAKLAEERRAYMGTVYGKRRFDQRERQVIDTLTHARKRDGRGYNHTGDA